MINISNLPTPAVYANLDYEVILDENIENFKKIFPSWQPLESDEFKMIIEAFSYREFHLRSEINNLSKAFFLSTATGDDLDNYATFYGVQRLQGSKPYAEYEFSLSGVIDQDVTIPANLVLTDQTNIYASKLLQDVTIKAGDLTASGVVELQKEISTIEIHTEIITTSLPFVITATASDDFANGSTLESDEDFRERILLSMADKSTAGSEETYKSYTFNADERIEDVAVLSSSPGVVDVYYYSEQKDQLMNERIVETLNAKDVRPLTDVVNVYAVEEIAYSITADLKILPNQETATVYSNAVASLNNGIESLKKVGTQITLSEINNFLKVDGVKEVVVSFPGENISINENQIGICSGTTITYTII